MLEDWLECIGEGNKLNGLRLQISVADGIAFILC